jgi:hypothetical protein
VSGFLSPKFLRYRSVAGVTIEEDLHCPSCGYNLRGLTYGRSCPECGHHTEPQREVTDVMTSGGEEDRARWRTGLGLAALCVFVALATRIAYYGASFAGIIPDAVTVTYLGAGAINSIVWIVAVWLVTPRSLLKRWPWMRPFRWVARGLACAWIAGYACVIMTFVQQPAPIQWVIAGNVLGRLLGGVGVMIVAFMLTFVAEEAELEKPTRRLSAAVWLLWLPTAIAQAFPPWIAWFTLVILGFVLFFWGWLMSLLGLALLEMHRHAAWARRHATESVGRQARIDEQRREIDAAVEATVRPVPERSNEDLPLDQRRSGGVQHD